VKKKMTVIGALLVAIVGLSLATSLSAASARVKPAATPPYCEYGEYNQYGECCTYNEYGECVYTSNPGSTPSAGSSPTQTISGGAKAAGLTVRTTYPKDSTLVDVDLPAGITARKFYIYTVKGVSFGANHSYKLLKKDILAYNGSTGLKYTITQLSRPHGRIHILLSKPLASPTFKVSKNVFEFTPAEARLIKRLGIKKTTVSIQVTATTGQVYTVHFKALFGGLVVVKFH
jgi:hypothetical protein